MTRKLSPLAFAVARLPETRNPVVAGVGDAFCDAILQIVFGVLRPTRL